MWKKWIIAGMFVLMFALVPVQNVHARLTRQTMDKATDFPVGDSEITGSIYYKYTATKTELISFKTIGAEQSTPFAVMYNSMGQKIHQFSAQSYNNKNINETFIMQKGITYYFYLVGSGSQYTVSFNTEEANNMAIKNITIEQYPCSVDYYEIQDDIYPYGKDEWFEDLRIRIEWEGRNSTVENYGDRTISPIMDSLSWLSTEQSVCEDGTDYYYVYYCGYPIRVKKTVKEISSIMMKTVKEKEAFLVSYQDGNWQGCSFTPVETGYYDINYSVTGSFKYVLLNENKTMMAWQSIGDDTSEDKNNRNQHIYLVEGHTYYLLGGPYTRKATGKFLFKKSAFQQKYRDVTIVKPENVSYTGKEHKPEPVIRYKGEDVSDLGWYVKYTYLYNVEPGTAVVKMECNTAGKTNGLYSYELYTHFYIRQPIDKATVTIPQYSYTGSAIVPETVVKLGEKTLEQGKDYIVKVVNNMDAGTATTTITGIGRYEGSIKKNFTIQPVNWNIEVNDTFIKDVKSKTFKLKAKSDAALVYKSKNKKIAKVNNNGTVTVGKYGTTFITVTASADKNHLETKKKVKVVVTSKMSKVKSVKKSSKGKTVVKLQKATGANGYEVTYSTDKEFKSDVKRVATKKTSVILKKLKSKTKYYIRVRSYRKVNGKNLYSDYSKAKEYSY